MNLSDIRKMSDKELNSFLIKAQSENRRICSRCHEFILEKRTISVRKDYTTRTLCILCENCYTDLLDYLAINDVDWRQN